MLSKGEMMARWVKSTWILLTCTALVASLLLYDGKPNSDAEVLLGYAMLTLTFPIGAGLATGIGAFGRFVFETTGQVFATSYTSMALVWLAFFAAGYIQWFVLIPKLQRWQRGRRSKGSARH